MQYLLRKIKTKITLQVARNRGKLEETFTAYHREPHMIS